MNKKAILIPIIALTTLFSASLFLPHIFAASPTPSPLPSASPVTDKQVIENLKKLVEKSDDPQETNPASSARAYIGTVKDIIKDTVIIEDKDGKKDIKLENSTLILRTPGSATIKAENIRIDDYIIAIGYPLEDNSLTGRRLLVSVDPFKAPEKTSGIGTISKITKSDITLKLADKDQTVDITSKTVFKSSSGTIEFSALEIGDTVIFTAKIDDEELTATNIMRVHSSLEQ